LHWLIVLLCIRYKRAIIVHLAYVEVNKTNKFCKFCGTQVEKHCSKCYHLVIVIKLFWHKVIPLSGSYCTWTFVRMPNCQREFPISFVPSFQSLTRTFRMTRLVSSRTTISSPKTSLGSLSSFKALSRIFQATLASFHLILLVNHSPCVRPTV
jgi:hypothetical protein